MRLACWLFGHAPAHAGTRQRDVVTRAAGGWLVVCERSLVWRCARCGRAWQVCTDIWTERERVA